MLIILTFVSPDSLVVDFLDWFSGTVEVAIDHFCIFCSIIPGTCDAQINVAFPSFYPLLFAVCWELKPVGKGKVKECFSISVAYLVLFAV